jgi:hypothetical protein
MIVSIAQQAAPAWVPALAFAIPAAIMLALLTWGVRTRRRARRARRAQEGRAGASAVDVGSVEAIPDPSHYSIEAVLTTLAVRPEDHGPTPEGMPHDEGWMGTMLGLRSRMSSSTSVLEPHVHWGERQAGQVFVRVGPDEKLEGGTTMLSNRHVRAITVLRVAAPPFDVTARRGALRASPESPAEIDGLLAGLTGDEATWGGAIVAGGSEGIVASRGAIDGTVGSWVYDLWLCEWIARSLRLPPLPPARVGPSWRVPYGFGRALEPERR